MLMNKLSLFYQKSFLYIFRKRTIEKIISKYYKKFSQQLKNKTILEIGCGSGYGAKIIKQYFTPKRIIAVDLDTRLINFAKRNVNDSSIIFEVGDASKLKYENNKFNAIFDFGAIHHIPNWRNCLKESYRVLNPGGKIFIYDISIESFSGLIGCFTRMITLHPYELMYKRQEFIDFLKKLGFKILDQKLGLAFGRYFIIVAEK